MRVHSSIYIGSLLKLKSFFVSILAFCLFNCSLSFAQSVPPLINYQGRLTDANGDGLTGTKRLEFNVYDAATGGNIVWGIQIIDNVPLVDGHFNVILSTDNQGRSIADAFNSKNRYIAIKAGEPHTDLSGVPEISPRQQILSAPYAVQAARAAMADHAAMADRAAISTHHSNIIPVGTIVAFWGTTAPAGWRICNGQHDTPSLRGVFLRGLDNGRNLDPGRGRGTYQADEFKSHNHANLGFKYLLACDGHNTAKERDDSSSEPNIKVKGEIQPAGGSETRPKNVAFNFIVYVGY